MIFILAFASLYGLLNYYVFRTLAAAFPDASFFIATQVALLYLSLFVATLLEKRGALKTSLPFSWLGYTWLGLSGIAFVLCALGDFAQLLGIALSNELQGISVAIGTVVLGAYGAVAAWKFRVRKVCLTSSKLPPGRRPIRIVQISDLHLGDSASLRRTETLVDAVNAQSPDIVVSTGDLFDGYLGLMAPYVDILRRIEAPLGRFAVSGNHEAYAGMDAALSLTELAGFTVLRNRSAVCSSELSVAGVEDPASPLAPDENAALAGVNPESFRVLLKHRPVIEAASRGAFDLQLSGHTHGGQIAPFHVFTKLAFKAKVGLSQVAPGQHLYLSRGSGSWGPQIRLLAPPEITLFEIHAPRD